MANRSKKFVDKNKNKKQKSLFNNTSSANAILRLNQAPLMLDKMICLTDSIYLLERMTRYYERKTSHVEILDNESSPMKTNKYSKLQAGPVDTSSSPQQQAKDEFALYQRYNDVAYLPEMKALKVLGSIDDVGDPKEPVYEIGPVKSRGKNLDKRQKNHADYMDEKGGYDIVSYLNDFSDRFPALSHVGIGQLCPHISTEVDCESLFSTAGFMSHPRRANTNIRTYERLVKGKHCLQRIYCHVPSVYRMYMKRHKEGDWDEKDNREDDRFLELEKEIWKEMYPHHSEQLDEEYESDEDGEESEDEVEEKEADAEESSSDSEDGKKYCDSDSSGSSGSSRSEVVVVRSSKKRGKRG